MTTYVKKIRVEILHRQIHGHSVSRRGGCVERGRSRFVLMVFRACSYKTIKNKATE